MNLDLSHEYEQFKKQGIESVLNDLEKKEQNILTKIYIFEFIQLKDKINQLIEKQVFPPDSSINLFLDVGYQDLPTIKITPYPKNLKDNKNYKVLKDIINDYRPDPSLNAFYKCKSLTIALDKPLTDSDIQILLSEEMRVLLNHTELDFHVKDSSHSDGKKFKL